MAELTLPELATHLGVSEKFIYWMIENENIPVRRKDAKIFFSKIEIMEWLRDREIRRNFNESHPEIVSPLLGFKNALERGGVFRFVPGTDMTSVLYSFVLQMKVPVSEEFHFLFGLIMKEAKNIKLAIGEGMAVLGFQYPLAWPEIPPAAYIGFLEKSIDFCPPSGNLVGNLFCLMYPTKRVQNHLYSRLSWLLRQPNVQDAISGRRPSELILKEVEKAEKGYR